MGASTPSHLRAALRLLAEGVKRRGSAEPTPSAVPRRRLAVERSDIVVEPGRVLSYLAATGGEGIAALRDENAPLPPAYCAVWETALALELLALEGAPLPRHGMIHVESELISVRPLRSGERIRSRLELDRADPHHRGLLLTLKSRNWNGAGQLCQENRLALLLPRPGPARDPGPGPGTEDREADASLEWRELASWSLAAGHGRRYARVSGDFNPIHLWRWSSRLLGFDRPVLHGFCTEAMVAHAVVERLLGGDPAALRRLAIRFRQPLSLPAQVRLLWSPLPSGGGRRFRVVDASGAEERRPYAEGEFVGG